MTRAKRPMPEVECRAIPQPVELRNSNGGRAIGGYASVFNLASRDLGGFVEIVEPSAFNKSRGDGYPGVVCRADHGDVLGSTRGGTLQLSVDNTGLDYLCDVAETRSGDDILALVRRGDYAGSSFAFNVFEDEWRNNGHALVRHLVSVRLLDVSPVAIPAYEAATVSLRSLAAQVDAPMDDVLALAQNGQLSKLLTRSDIQQHRPRSGRQAQTDLMKAPKAGAVQPVTLTPAQARKQLTDMAMPNPRKTVAERRAELTHMARPLYQTAAELGMRDYSS